MTKNALLAALKAATVKQPNSVGTTTEELQVAMGHRDPRKARKILGDALRAGVVARVTRYKEDLAGRVIPIPAFVPVKKR